MLRTDNCSAGDGYQPFVFSLLSSRNAGFAFSNSSGNFGHTGAAWAQADFNGDGIVDSLDFNALASDFGFKAPAGDVALGSVVPEPTWISLLACLLILRRQRRSSVARVFNPCRAPQLAHQGTG